MEEVERVKIFAQEATQPEARVTAIISKTGHLRFSVDGCEHSYFSLAGAYTILSNAFEEITFDDVAIYYRGYRILHTDEIKKYGRDVSLKEYIQELKRLLTIAYKRIKEIEIEELEDKEIEFIFY